MNYEQDYIKNSFTELQRAYYSSPFMLKGPHYLKEDNIAYFRKVNIELFALFMTCM